MALLENFVDVNFCEKENSCISAAMPSAKFVMISLEETDCEAVAELLGGASAKHYIINIFTEGMFKNISIPSKNPDTYGCNSAGSQI